MALLYPPRSLPQMVRAVYNLLIHSNEKTVSEEKLLKIIAPQSLQRSGSNSTEINRDSLRDSIAAGITLKILERVGSELRVHPDFTSEIGSVADSDRAFMISVRNRVFSDPAWIGDIEGNEGPKDFLRALVWFLMQDPYVPLRWEGEGESSVEYRQQAMLGERTNWVINNDTRWVTFLRWAFYLGYAWRYRIRSSVVYVPDPTIVVFDTLSSYRRGETTRFEIAEIIKMLSEKIPVFDSGSIRVAFEQANGIPCSVKGASVVLSQSLSLALLNLSDQKMIKPHLLDDIVQIGIQEELGKVSFWSHVSIPGINGEGA